jgi:predicted glycoside hydrolase/deacetylase ChbG (UPF0249 family)
VERCVAEQLAAFTELHGRPPTHVDGHKHVQVSPTVARTPALDGMRMRRAFDDAPTSHPAAVAARRIRHRLTFSGRGTTDRFVPIDRLRGDLSAGQIPSVLVASGTVEVMVHPGAQAERALLGTPGWSRVVATLVLGSYEDLP